MAKKKKQQGSGLNFLSIPDDYMQKFSYLCRMIAVLL